MRQALIGLLAAALASPCAALPELTADIAVSSQPASSSQSPSSATGGIGISSEGKPLEMTVWGGSGAIVGSLAGPIGTIVGAAVGALGGLLISIFVVPHNGPERKPAAHARMRRSGGTIPLDKFPT